MERASHIKTLQRIDVPVLFVYGKNDSRIPLEVAAMHALLPHHSEMLMLDHTAHMPFLEERDIVKSRLHDFVKACYMSSHSI